MNPLVKKFLSRRFLMSLGCGIVTTGLVWFGKIDGEVYAAVIIATVASYITGGTAQRFSAVQHPPEL